MRRNPKGMRVEPLPAIRRDRAGRFGLPGWCSGGMPVRTSCQSRPFDDLDPELQHAENGFVPDVEGILPLEFRDDAVAVADLGTRTANNQLGHDHVLHLHLERLGCRGEAVDLRLPRSQFNRADDRGLVR